MHAMTKEDILLDYLSKNLERDTIFFTEDCSSCGLSLLDIRLNLSSLVKQGRVVRLARGLFLWPSHEDFSGHIRMPSMERIAHAIAAREHCRIIPCGEQCAYLAGLTTLQVAPSTWITDGGDRVVNLANGRKIIFKRKDEARVFSMQSQPMQRLTLGMRAIGKEKIGFPEKRAIQAVLAEVSDEDFVDAIWKTTEWVRDLLVDLHG